MLMDKNGRSGRLTAETVRRSAVRRGIRADMWNLFSRYYAGTSRECFERDLDNKSHVIVLRDSGSQEIAGFSTIAVRKQQIRGRTIVSIFSGDTVVSSRYWGQRALHRAFFLFIMRTKLRYPTVPVYWFLITKGYKTYLLLARNFPECWPRRQQVTPVWEQQIIDELARGRFGDAWTPETGILRFDDCPCRLRSNIAPIRRALLEDPDIRFFAERNPGHANGDELCCIGLVDSNVARAFLQKQAKRVLQKGHEIVSNRWTAVSHRWQS